MRIAHDDANRRFFAEWKAARIYGAISIAYTDASRDPALPVNDYVETALAEVALSVQIFVEPSFLLPFRPRGDHRLDVASLQSVANGVGVVCCIGETNSAWQVVQELLCNRSFVLLAGGELNVPWPTLKVGDQVNLGGEATS